MAVETNIWDETYRAIADMQSCQYAFVKFSGAATVALCDISGEAACGILQNNPYSGDNAVVRMAGLSKVRAAATIAVNLMICTDHSGRALGVTLGSGDYSIAMTRQVLADGGMYEVIVRGTPHRMK